MLHTVMLKYNNGSYQYQIFANLSAAGIALGPKLHLAIGVCVCVGGGGELLHSVCFVRSE